MDNEDVTELEQQPTGTDVHGPEGTDQPSEADRVRYGMQKRIDALTASRHQQAAQIEMLQQQIAQQMATLTERMSAVQAQPQADPFEELDPALAKALRYQSSMMEAKLAEQRKMFDTAMAAAQVQQVAQQANLPPEVAARAQQVMEGAKKNGLPMNAQDAADWALGEAIRTGKYKPPAQQQAPRAANGQFAPVNSVYSTSPQVDVTPTVKPLPANFDSLDPDEQIRVLQARGADKGFL